MLMLKVDISSLFDPEMILVSSFQFGVILSSSLWEQLGMVYIGWRSAVFPVGKFFWDHVDIVKRYFPFMAYPKIHFSFHFGMDCLIKSDNDVISGLPLEPSLPRYDIIWVYSLSSKLFNTVSEQSYPSLRPAESFVLLVELACIFEA
jgi:hypothetical protein